MLKTQNIPEDLASQAKQAPAGGTNYNAEACGKAIIVGEHAVIYGSEAIAMPLKNLKLEVDLNLDQCETPLIIDQTRRFKRRVSENLSNVIGDATELLGQKRTPIDIHCQSEILIGAGLGSSAALCVALLRAMAKAFKIEVTTEKISEYATTLEGHFHGKSSGLDIAVVALEQVIAFRRGESPRPVDVSSDARNKIEFALIDSGTRASTSAMVQQAAPYFSGSNGEKRIDLFNQIAHQVKQGLKHCNLEEIGQAMNHAASLLYEARVVTDNLKGIQETLCKLGVLGCKTTGAGGGGYVMALLNPEIPDLFETIAQNFGPQKVLKVGF